ncbi:MAG: hypothetical protein HKP27_09365, partial [Myxococcales bacterium]|nr:hypothetical protein [Myxococcales bacterium]
MEGTAKPRLGGKLGSTQSELRLVRASSIDELDTRSWDSVFGGGLCQSQALRVLERSFDARRSAEHRWRFFYYEVWEDRRCVLRTFFTSALCKEDMLAPAPVSRLAEARREQEPEFLVSRLFLMGSLLSESRHLWCDPTADRSRAIALLLDAVARDADSEQAGTIILGQFAEEGDALAPLFREFGFHSTPFPEAYDLAGFRDPAAWFNALSSKARRHVRKEVFPYADRFAGAARPISSVDAAELREAFR